MLDVFHFLCFIFCRGVTSQKRCLYTRCFVDRINHFNSKWWVKYLVLFVVGAASLRPSRCKQHSRKIFFQRLLRLSSKFLPNAFMSQTLQLFFVISTLIFCSQCLQFFNILIFDLDFGFWICFFALWIVKNLYLKNLFLKNLFLKNLCCVACNTSTEKPVSEKSVSK